MQVFDVLWEAVLLFVGDDWAEDHHDVEVQDESGRKLCTARLEEGGSPDQVLVGIETDRGPWVGALVAAGYQVYAVNPRQVARFRA